MPSAAEQALVTLIPSINNLPSELINLANALLIQSRSRATNLKNDEEIGRIYACSHIACERLQSKLSLPKLQPRPPVPPRIYKKLHTYLNGILTTPATPTTQRHVDALNRSGATTPAGPRAASTPGSRKRPFTNDKSPSKVLTSGAGHDTPTHGAEKRMRTPSTKVLDGGGATSTGRKRRDKLANDHVAPAWTAAMIERLALAFNQPQLTAIISDGLDAAIARNGLGPRDFTDINMDDRQQDGKLSEEHLPATLAVLALYVIARQGGRQLREEEHQAMRRKAIKAVQEVEEGRRIGEPEMLEAVKRLMKTAMEAGWLSLPWFTSIGSHPDAPEVPMDLGELGVDDQDDDDDTLPVATRKRTVIKTPLRRKEKHAPRPGGDEEETPAAGLLPGLGTMFQDAVDWLSDERREQFREWKADILRRIEETDSAKKTGKSASRQMASAA